VLVLWTQLLFVILLLLQKPELALREVLNLLQEEWHLLDLAIAEDEASTFNCLTLGLPPLSVDEEREEELHSSKCFLISV
jgi:hypothetical protein